MKVPPKGFLRLRLRSNDSGVKLSSIVADSPNQVLSLLLIKKDKYAL